MAEIVKKLYKICVEHIFYTDIIFTIAWLIIFFFKEKFARLVRIIFLGLHLVANFYFGAKIRSYFATGYYFLGVDKQILSFFQKNPEWVKGFMGSLTYITWLMYWFVPLLLELKKGNTK